MHLSTKGAKKSTEVRKSIALFNSAFSKTFGKLFGNAGPLQGFWEEGGFRGEIDFRSQFFFIGL